MAGNENSIENKNGDILGLGEIKKALQNFIDTLKNGILDTLGIKQEKEIKDTENEAKQAEENLENEVKNGDNDINQKKNNEETEGEGEGGGTGEGKEKQEETKDEKEEEKEETEKEAEGETKKATEKEKGLKDEEWRKKGKFIISGGILANQSNTRFGINGTNSDAKIILNGPLFESGGKPVGGFIEKGTVIKDFKTEINENLEGNFYYNNGVIGYGTDGKMHMFSYKDIKKQEGAKVTLKDEQNITFIRAFQNGPMLVKDGAEQTTSNKKRVDRTAIGFTTDGEIRAIHGKRVTLSEMAIQCKSEGLTNAMYLDGSSGIAGMQNGKTGEKRGGLAKGATGLQLG